MERSRRRITTAVVGAAVVALSGGVLLLRSRLPANMEWPADARAPSHTPVSAVQQHVSRERPAVRAGARAATRESAESSDLGPLPASLQGTDIDGWLGVDDDGHLVVTPGARWFFDYFLSATGEEPPAHIRTRLVAEIEKRLPPAGAQEAIDLLDRYLAYRERVRTLQESGAPEDLQQRLSQLHEIRQEILGDGNAAALFGEEEKTQLVDIQRRQVLSDQTLSPDERQRKLDELEQQLPASVREARAQALGPVRLMQDEQQLREAGAAPEEMRALREQQFGAEAADRLEALDRERAEWQQRVDDYRTARRAIEANSSLSAAARAHAVDTLLGERFTAQERLRVEADNRAQTTDNR
jgi:lipase chaperone LimK